MFHQKHIAGGLLEPPRHTPSPDHFPILPILHSDVLFGPLFPLTAPYPLDFTPTLLPWLLIWFLPFIMFSTTGNRQPKTVRTFFAYLTRSLSQGWFGDSTVLSIKKAGSVLPSQLVSSPTPCDCQMTATPLGNIPYTKPFARCKRREARGCLLFPLFYQVLKSFLQALNHLLFTLCCSSQAHMSTPRPITSNEE